MVLAGGRLGPVAVGGVRKEVDAAGEAADGEERAVGGKGEAVRLRGVRK